jgi:hypothetical protein
VILKCSCGSDAYLVAQWASGQQLTAPTPLCRWCGIAAASVEPLFRVTLWLWR